MKMVSLKNLFLLILILAGLYFASIWNKYGEFENSLGFDLSASASAAAQRVAGDRPYLIVRERPQTFVDSFDEISLGELARTAWSSKRGHRTYHFRIVVDQKSYYWSFQERAFLPTVKPGIWDSDESLLVHMAKKCSIFRSISGNERKASFEQTRWRFDVPVSLASYCID